MTVIPLTGRNTLGPYESRRESFISKLNPSPSELDLGMGCLTLKKTECSGGQRQRNTIPTPCGQRITKRGTGHCVQGCSGPVHCVGLCVGAHRKSPGGITLKMS